MNNLYEIIGNLLAAFAVGLLAYLAPKARAWFEANTNAATQENIRRLVQSVASVPCPGPLRSGPADVRPGTAPGAGGGDHRSGH